MTSPAECLKEAEKFLQDRNVPYATICFCMVTGSVAYDLSTPSSDVDYLGVYVARSDDLLCIESPVPVNSLSVLPEEAGKRPDITMYELGQFLRQLVKGNPFAIEALFSTSSSYRTPLWEELFAMKRTVLNARTIEEFLVYIRDQLKSHIRKPLVGKRIYHVVRLLFEIKRIVRGEDIHVSITIPEEREYLVRIRGCQDPSRCGIEEFAQTAIQELRAQEPWPLIPRAPDEQMLNDWLVSKRMAFLGPL